MNIEFGRTAGAATGFDVGASLTTAVGRWAPRSVDGVWAGVPFVVDPLTVGFVAVADVAGAAIGRSSDGESCVAVPPRSTLRYVLPVAGSKSTAASSSGCVGFVAIDGDGAGSAVFGVPEAADVPEPDGAISAGGEELVGDKLGNASGDGDGVAGSIFFVIAGSGVADLRPCGDDGFSAAKTGAAPVGDGDGTGAASDGGASVGLGTAAVLGDGEGSGVGDRRDDLLEAAAASSALGITRTSGPAGTARSKFGAADGAASVANLGGSAATEWASRGAAAVAGGDEPVGFSSAAAADKNTLAADAVISPPRTESGDAEAIPTAIKLSNAAQRRFVMPYPCC